MARTLRSKAERWLLFEAAGGKCSICGVPLDNGWHADHIVPFSISRRTNVHEMQALCSTCNLRKGAKMALAQNSLWTETSFPWDDVLDRMRIGQRGAVSTIRDRFISRQLTSSIVLPTRYGKSDVMRVAGMGLVRDGHAGIAIVLAPNEIVVDQLVDVRSKISPMCIRLGIMSPPVVRRVVSLEHNYQANGEELIAMTLQLVQQNLSAFVTGIESIQHRTQRPALIMIDEAHMIGGDNAWAEVAKAFNNIGAHVSLLTAFQYRETGLPWGFETELINEEGVEWNSFSVDELTGRRRVLRYAGTEQRYKLVADFEFSFQRAWAERPSPLCKISRKPFDVSLRDASCADGDDQRMLSDLSETEVRKHLSRVVQSGFVVGEGVRLMFEHLDPYLKISPNTAALVFCGNDKSSDSETNKHANAIKEEILRQRPGTPVVIATSADGPEAKGRIQRFVGTDRREGEGTVLICKQMASVGLDAERIKVELDLSTIRTAASCIQRWTRPATPSNQLKTCIVITPNDALSSDLFQRLVTDQGGEAVIRVGELVEEYTPDGSIEDASIGSIYYPIGVETADFQDQTGDSAEAIRAGQVKRMKEAFPVLATQMSDVEIAKGVTLVFADETTDLRSIDMTLQEQVEALWKKLEDLEGRITVTRIERDHGKHAFKEAYPAVSMAVWAEIRNGLGIDRSVKLRQITDLSILNRMVVKAEQLKESCGA